MPRIPADPGAAYRADRSADCVVLCQFTSCLYSLAGGRGGECSDRGAFLLRGTVTPDGTEFLKEDWKVAKDRNGYVNNKGEEIKQIHLIGKKGEEL